MVTVVLRLPSPRLSPNSRGHWTIRAREVRKYRQLAAWTATAERPSGWVALREATILSRFWFRDRRRRDRDNLLASMKSAYDGLVDAGILEDDSGVIHLPIEVGYDRARPRVEIVVSPVSPRRVGEADRA